MLVKYTPAVVSLRKFPYIRRQGLLKLQREEKGEQRRFFFFKMPLSPQELVFLLWRRDALVQHGMETNFLLIPPPPPPPVRSFLPRESRSKFRLVVVVVVGGGGVVVLSQPRVKRERKGREGEAKQQTSKRRR